MNKEKSMNRLVAVLAGVFFGRLACLAVFEEGISWEVSFFIGLAVGVATAGLLVDTKELLSDWRRICSAFSDRLYARVCQEDFFAASSRMLLLKILKSQVLKTWYGVLNVVSTACMRWLRQSAQVCKKILVWLRKWSLPVVANEASILFLSKVFFPGIVTGVDPFDHSLAQWFFISIATIFYLIVLVAVESALMNLLEVFFKRPPLPVIAKKVFCFLDSCDVYDIVLGYWWGKFLIVWIFFFGIICLTADAFLIISFFACAVIVEIAVVLGNLLLALAAQKRQAVIIGIMVGYGAAFLLDDSISTYKYATVVGMVVGAMIGEGLFFFRTKLEEKGCHQFTGILSLSLKI